MDEFREYAIFAEIVATGSMTAAARRLGMTPSAVSQALRSLETRTGVALLLRTTRRLSLTEAGGRCLPHCRRMVESAAAARESLEQARDAPSGELRVAAPFGFALHLAPALAPVLADWPGLGLRIFVDDRSIDLVAERIDVAIRVGDLTDSTWIAKRLCEFEPILCASPTYLERHGTPTEPGELDRFGLIATATGPEVPTEGPFQSRPMTVSLHLRNGDRTASVEPPVRVSTSSQVALAQLCEEGMGIAKLFRPDVLPALERGALIRLLPGWSMAASPVTMLHRDRTYAPAKVKVATAAIARHFSSLSGKPDSAKVEPPAFTAR